MPLRSFTPEGPPAGTLIHGFGLFSGRRITQKDIDYLIEKALANAEDADVAREIRNTYADVPWPETLPPYLRFLTDPQGCLWVEESRLPTDEVPIWTVFGSDGGLRSRVSLPAGVEVLEIGEDHILGLWKDDMDVEYVRMYALDRGG